MILEKSRLELPNVLLPVASHRMPLIHSAMNCDNICGILFTRESHETLSNQGFQWGCSCGHSLPITYQNSRPPEEKLVLSINDSVCSLGTINHSYEGRVGTNKKSKFPDTSQGPALQAGLSKWSSAPLTPPALFHT